MDNLKWAYAAKGHYSARENGWTVHVLDNGAVYKTHPSRDIVDVTGAKADRYIESVPAKFPIRGRKRAEPKREAKEKKPPATKPKAKKKTKRQIASAAKRLAKDAGAVIGTTRAFVTEVGEAEERAYAKRKAPPPKKKAKPKKTRREAQVPEMEHPLGYLVSGAGALPPVTRKRQPRSGRAQTLEEYMGWN